MMSNKTYMPYKTYSMEEFQELIRTLILKPQNKSEKIIGKHSVYDELFSGLDITLLSLMCTQVKWSLVKKQRDQYITVIENYADLLVDIIPIWKNWSDTLMAISGKLSEDFNKIYMLYFDGDDEGLHQIFADVRNKLGKLKKDGKLIIDTINKKQNTLINFIGGKLIPISKDVAKWKEYNLDNCFYNDKFVYGTEASMRNAGILFSFIDGSISKSIDIINNAIIESSDEIMFTVDGQSDIWKLMGAVTQKLNKSTLDFRYKPLHT